MRITSVWVINIQELCNWSNRNHNNCVDGYFEEAITPVTLEELIAEGESDELEFKSTLRWDIHEGVINKKLEEVAIKTVAAFANSQGGTLLIGI